MDPFSGESELLNLTTAFYTHAYQSVLDYDISQLSSTNRSAAQILKYRAQIALGNTREVVNAVGKSRDAASRAIVALAKNDVAAATALADSSDSEDNTVQILAGTVLANNGEYAKAIELLSKHQGSLEAVALLVQTHLLNNRTDLAVKEISAAKRWAQDSLIVNLAEAWMNIRVGGSEKYQSAYYVYEELASAPGNQSPTALVSQAVAELHLGRVEEAEAALNQAMEKEVVDVEALANMIVLLYITGKSKDDRVNDLKETLRQRDAEHKLLTDAEEKERLFDTAAAKYSARAATTA